MMIELLHGDCHYVLRTLADNSIDSIVTDPPYEIDFMGKYLAIAKARIEASQDDD